MGPLKMTSTKWPSSWQCYMIFSIITCIMYILTIDGDYVFDDAESVVNNADAQCHRGLLHSDVWTNDFWGTPMSSSESHKSYRPITTLSFRLIKCAFASPKIELLAQHSVNIFLQCLIVSLLYSLMLTMVDNQPIAFITTLIFTVHPVHVECVANITGRAELLSAVCYISVLKLHTREWSLMRMGMCACVTFVGMLCKEQCVMVPIVCILLDVLNSGFKQIQRITANLAIFIGLTTFRLYMSNFESPKFTSSDNAAAFEENFMIRTVNYLYIYMINIQLLIAPCWLCFDWSMGCIPLVKEWNDERFVIMIAFGAVSFIGVVKIIKTWHSENTRLIVISIILIVVPFIPASNLFVTVGFTIAERVLYLPSIGYCLGVGVLIDYCNTHLRGEARRLLHTACLIYVTAMAVKTFSRAQEWRTEISLYSSALDVCPNNAKVHYNLAKVVNDENAAELRYRTAIDLHPHYDQALNNLANLLQRRGEHNESRHLLHLAIAIRPTFATAWMNLGIVNVALDHLPKAEEAYNEALRLRRHQCPDCFYNIGNLHMAGENLIGALEAWNNCTRQDAQHGRAWLNKLVLLDELGMHTQCVIEGESALITIRSTDRPPVQAALATCLAREGRFADAESHLVTAISKMPEKETAVHVGNLGVLYHRWGKWERAKNTYNKALRLNPNLTMAKNNLKLLGSHL